MIRALVERLPIMICPRWVQVKAQPIAIEDLLAYLLAALDLPVAASQVYEIGGPDQVSYGQIMSEYARQRGLSRWMIPVPLLTPYLSSLWLGLVTPLYARVGRKLVESLRNRRLFRTILPRRRFPYVPVHSATPLPGHWLTRSGICRNEVVGRVVVGGEAPNMGGHRYGSRLVDSRTITVATTPEQAFAPIRKIGVGLAGTTETGCGQCAVFWICSSAGLVFVAAVVIQTLCALATRSTFGESKLTSLTSGCGCMRK